MPNYNLNDIQNSIVRNGNNILELKQQVSSITAAMALIAGKFEAMSEKVESLCENAHTADNSSTGSSAFGASSFRTGSPLGEQQPSLIQKPDFKGSTFRKLRAIDHFLDHATGMGFKINDEDDEKTVALKTKKRQLALGFLNSCARTICFNLETSMKAEDVDPMKHTWKDVPKDLKNAAIEDLERLAAIGGFPLSSCVQSWLANALLRERYSNATRVVDPKKKKAAKNSPVNDKAVEHTGDATEDQEAAAEGEDKAVEDQETTVQVKRRIKTANGKVKGKANGKVKDKANDKAKGKKQGKGKKKQTVTVGDSDVSEDQSTDYDFSNDSDDCSGDSDESGPDLKRSRIE